jgi:hypothetical protein
MRTTARDVTICRCDKEGDVSYRRGEVVGRRAAEPVWRFGMRLLQGALVVFEQCV